MTFALYSHTILHGSANKGFSELVTVTIDIQDLESLSGVKLPSGEAELDELLSSLKCKDVKVLGDGTLTIENSDRADLWSPEGVARALRAYAKGKKGLKEYKAKKDSGVRVKVSPKVEKIRPYIGCSILTGVKLSDIGIRSVVQLQEKLDQSYGRRRARSSIGLYNFNLITPPLAYDVSEPDATRFVPLDGNELMTLREILDKHQKGIEYGHILKEHSEWPILFDEKRQVLSFPPIINSNDLGRITEDTRNVLIEVTGTARDTVLNALNLMTMALADRGGAIETSHISYPYGENKNETTPQLRSRRIQLSPSYASEVIGFRISRTEVGTLLARSGHQVRRGAKDTVMVEVPPYRLDVMHPVDLVEDVAFAYGLNNMKPRWPALSTIGGISSEQEFEDLLRELMIGLGFQEVLTYTLTNREYLYDKMRVPRANNIDIANARIQSMSCLRDWLLPSIMEVLSANTHVEYPQRIFEVGFCVQVDTTEETGTKDLAKISFASTHSEANFTEARSYVQPFMNNLGLAFALEETEHPSFIPGRAGRIVCEGTDLGIVGEIHPQVLEAWGLANPTCAAEMLAYELFRLVRPKR